MSEAWPEHGYCDCGQCIGLPPSRGEGQETNDGGGVMERVNVRALRNDGELAALLNVAEAALAVMRQQVFHWDSDEAAKLSHALSLLDFARGHCQGARERIAPDDIVRAVVPILDSAEDFDRLGSARVSGDALAAARAALETWGFPQLKRESAP